MKATKKKVTGTRAAAKGGAKSGAEVAKVRIHPAIGIARLGNSPMGHFIGPEIPGINVPPTGGYKDAEGRVKRQAVRFRLYGYDAKDQLVGEITAKQADITWTVHVANKKAEWIKFVGLLPEQTPRNAGVADRTSLIIDPGARSIAGPGGRETFDGGTFLGKKVPLGEMATDADGRLLVLGGFGTSESVPPGEEIVDYANNDKWHDDVSDGPVRADVVLRGSGRTVPVVPAWVICAPPDFAPPITSIVTLYDTLFQVAVDRKLLKEVETPSFTRDIHPILDRTIGTGWVVGWAAKFHKTLPDAFGPGASAADRDDIFGRLRDPALAPTEPGGNMPRLFSDHYKDFKPILPNLPLTGAQYNAMRKWAAGDFEDDWKGAPPAPAKEITPEGLDRAALEACVGGACYPGIEAGWNLRDTFPFAEPFRLAQGTKGLGAGDVTKQMAVPWQADFNQCRTERNDQGRPIYAWWPSQRPDDVLPEKSKDVTERAPWTREIVDSDEDMVDFWSRLGFVVQRGDRFVETERGSKSTTKPKPKPAPKPRP